MIKGLNIQLHPIQDEDWAVIDAWGKDRNALWGLYQRFQLTHLPQFRQAYQKTALLTREVGFLLIETIPTKEIIGFVRYTLIPYPDANNPCPEIGFGIPKLSAKGKGDAKEAVKLLINYLFEGYTQERIMAFTDGENILPRKCWRRTDSSAKETCADLFTEFLKFRP